MIAASAEFSAKARTGALLEARIAAHGSAAHPYFASHELLRGAHAARNLTDAVAFLCTLHGRHPSVIDLAAQRAAGREARAWLERSAVAFTGERRYLARLAAAAGPVPGTPGGSASETAAVAQRGALAILAESERRGCALGAAIALIADWAAIRAVLDLAAHRLGLEPQLATLPRREEIVALAESAGATAGEERALLFGAEQLLVQHYGLWALLEARAHARDGL